MLGAMTTSFFTFPRPDGTSLYVHAFRAPNARANLLIVHGMSEHGARYARLAERANAAGISVYAPDLRGHGKTAASLAALGHMADRDAIGVTVDDLCALIQHLREQSGLPMGILGHSMGSFITQQLLSKSPPIVAAVFSGSTGKPPILGHVGRVVARVERLRLGARGKSPVIHALTFENYNKHFAPTRTESDWLSRDPAEVDAYVEDPFCGFQCSTATWIALLDSLAIRLSGPMLARWPRVPLYVVSGDQDAVGEFGKGPPRLRDTLVDAGFDVTFDLYAGGRHEMLNELNRDEVEAKIVAFLDASLGGGE
jgi:alpha-beta hydrolase superfamily lysophospholipase